MPAHCSALCALPLSGPAGSSSLPPWFYEFAGTLVAIGFFVIAFGFVLAYLTSSANAVDQRYRR